jgi:hypothetical protein
MHQHIWGYKVEEKLYLGVREQKRLNTAVLDYTVNYRLLLFNILLSCDKWHRVLW